MFGLLLGACGGLEEEVGHDEHALAATCSADALTLTAFAFAGTSLAWSVEANGVAAPLAKLIDPAGNLFHVDLSGSIASPAEGTWTLLYGTAECAPRRAQAVVDYFFEASFTYDPIANCRGPGGGRVDIVLPEMPAGTYRATLTSGAINYWGSVSLPRIGWLVASPTCTAGLDLSGIATALGARYTNAADAFAAANRETILTFGGGSAICYLVDNPCGDNLGRMSYHLERIGP